MDTHLQVGALMALATGNAATGIEIANNLARDDAQPAVGGPRVVSAPGQLGSSICDQSAMRAEMEALGFVWLDEPSRDARALLTQYVRLQMPEGWTFARGTDSRENWLLDPRGIRRVSLYDVNQFWDPYCSMVLVNLGGDISRRLVYSDMTPDELGWPVLTEAERAEVLAALAGRVAEGERSRVYADTAAKAARWIATLTEGPGESS